MFLVAADVAKTRSKSFSASSRCEHSIQLRIGKLKVKFKTACFLAIHDVSCCICKTNFLPCNSLQKNAETFGNCTDQRNSVLCTAPVRRGLQLFLKYIWAALSPRAQWTSQTKKNWCEENFFFFLKFQKAQIFFSKWSLRLQLLTNFPLFAALRLPYVHFDRDTTNFEFTWREIRATKLKFSCLKKWWLNSLIGHFAWISTQILHFSTQKTEFIALEVTR